MLSFKLLSATALFISTAFGVDVRGYSNAVGCSGSYFHNDNGGGVCITFPTGFRGSAQWVGLPAGAQGQGYSDTCSTFLFAEFGPGSPCHTTGGQGFKTLNWFHSPHKAIPGVSKPESKGVECEGPTGFTYETEDGTTKTVDVTDMQHAEELAGLYFAENYTALAMY